MKIIILTVGEPPLYDSLQRLHRSGILAHKLSNNHIVQYWSSNFFHQQKKFIKTGKYQINKNLSFVSFPSIGYKKNISMMRYIDQFIFGFQIFFKLINNRNNIDLILVSLPTCDLAFFVSLFSKIFNKKYIVDVRDMWPDIFWLKFNNKKILSSMIKIFSLPQLFFRNFSLKNANAITSITKEFLDWSLKHKKNSKNTLSNYFYLSPNNKFINNIKKGNDNKINICFFGVISYSKFDFETLFKFLKSSNSKINDFYFHICGDGDDLEKIKIDSLPFKNVKIYGYLNNKELLKIACISQFGLANYIPTIDFKMSIPNKIIEYLSYNLKIIYSLDGSTKNLLNQNNIGHYYKARDIDSFTNTLLNLNCNDTRKIYYNFYKKYFDKEKIYNSFCKFIESVNEKK